MDEVTEILVSRRKIVAVMERDWPRWRGASVAPHTLNDYPAFQSEVRHRRRPELPGTGPPLTVSLR
jgi:hypothetical protein